MSSTQKMSLADVKKAIEGNFEIISEQVLSNNTGCRIELNNGSIINTFNTGTVQVQGKNSEEMREFLFGHKIARKCDSRKVFVVYGHDNEAKTALEAMLRRWGLEPIFLDQLPSEGKTIIEKLDKHTDESRVSFAVVLATPDDEGHRKNYPDEKLYRARQNVVLELGMMLAKLGRNKVAILIRDVENMEKPSDIQGLLYIPFKNDLQKEVGPNLAREMAEQGFDIDVKKL